MFKKYMLWIACVFISTLSVVPTGFATSDDLAQNARSAVLIDAASGRVLFEKNAHQSMPPASITKVMTMLLLMEAIENKKITWTDKIRTSERAASMGGSQIFLQPGEEMSVRDMLKGIAMASGNDTSVAVAERLAGTEARFVEKMNARAKQLGMKDSKFQNSNGLPVADHFSSAYDIALMSRALLQYPEITKFTGAYEDHLRKDQPKPFWLVNTNKLVRFYQGADGLKTGFTNEAKYCLTATAKKSGMRVIAVVMGEPDSKIRNAEVMQLFDYAFANYEPKIVVEKGKELGTIHWPNAEPNQLTVNAPKAYSILHDKNQDNTKLNYTSSIEWTPNLQPPIQMHQQVGMIVVKNGTQVVLKEPLYASQSIRVATWQDQWRRIIHSLIAP